MYLMERDPFRPEVLFEDEEDFENESRFNHERKKDEDELIKAERRENAKAVVGQEITKRSVKASPEATPLKRERLPRLESMSTPEILMAAGRLSVEDSDVRRLYEANLVDRRGLLRLIRAALRGDDLNSIYNEIKLGEEAQMGRKVEIRHDQTLSTQTTDDSKPTTVAAKKRIKKLEKALLAIQKQQKKNREAGLEDTDLPDLPAAALARRSRNDAKHAIRKKRIANIIALLIFLAIIAFVSYLLYRYFKS